MKYRSWLSCLAIMLVCVSSLRLAAQSYCSPTAPTTLITRVKDYQEYRVMEQQQRSTPLFLLTGMEV